MEINSIIPAVSASSTPTGNAAAKTNITSDFDMFLQLLTAQMQHQDPLDPMDTDQFSPQLAHFSAVEQQVYTNELLEGLQAGMATRGMGDLGGWIGMEARARMPVDFEGQTVTVLGTRNVLADRMELIVRNAQGEIVQQSQIPLSEAPFEWNGTGTDASSLPHGVYTLSVRNWSGEDLLDDSDAMVYSVVQEAQVVGTEIWLTMADGASIPATDVLGLRAPQDA
ncbi:MAG: flagellar hook capping FlgD N-terminal domain-containing protein [Roseicyclus sp.]